MTLLRRVLQIASLSLCAAACTEAGEAPAAESIEVVEVQLPPGVTIPSQQNSTGFTADGSRLFTTALIEGVEGRHVATLARDGSDFTCLLGSRFSDLGPAPTTNGDRWTADRSP